MKKYQKVILVFFILIAGTYLVLPILMNEENLTLNEETRKDAPGEFISLPQGLVHYQEAGRGNAETVLLIHGFSVPLYIWDNTYEDLKKAGFHVIRFDLFGRGYSDRPEGLYDRNFFDKQISDLLSALKVEHKINIIGVSMGGALATEFTVSHPGLVNKLILIDPFHEGKNISIAKHKGIGEFLVDIWKVPSMPKNTLGDFYLPEKYPDWPSKFEVQMQYTGFKKAILATIRNYITEDKLPVYTELGKLKKDVLLIWGEDDNTIPFKGNERIRKVVDCKFMNIPKARHIPHYEKSDTVSPAIIRFLNQKNKQL